MLAIKFRDIPRPVYIVLFTAGALLVSVSTGYTSGRIIFCDFDRSPDKAYYQSIRDFTITYYLAVPALLIWLISVFVFYASGFMLLFEIVWFVFVKKRLRRFKK